jgi:GAF domain-containing protein
VIGVLHVGTLTRRDFSDEEAQLLQLAADRMAVAIDHARLYESERQAVEHLGRLESVTEAALSHLALEELLDVLLVRLRDLLATDTVAVLLLRGDELHARAALGLDDGQAGALTVKVGEGFAGRIASECRPIAIDDVQSSEASTAALARSGVASLLGVPLVASGEVIGVLSVGTWQRRRFEREDIDVLVLAADRIATAIENARL